MIHFIDFDLVGIMVHMEDINRLCLLLLVYINLGRKFKVGMRVDIMMMEFNIIMVLRMKFMAINMRR